MRFKGLIICVAICLCISCGMREDTELERLGFSFTIPKGWYIIDEEISDESYRIGIGNKHIASDAYFYGIWFPFEKNLDDLAEIAKKSYKETIFSRVAEIEYSETKSVSFKDHKAVMVNYSSQILDLKHMGEIICFTWDSYSVILLFSADEKKFDKFVPVFRKIKNSINRIEDNDEDDRENNIAIHRNAKPCPQIRNEYETNAYPLTLCIFVIL